MEITLVETAEREKLWAALSSVLAAVGLTAIKIIVGAATGSLGILAEAAHSGLDLAAALVTLFAVRISGKPADQAHPYGHGKVENLSALFETVLLLVTCGWIIYEAIQRLFYKTVDVEVTIWAFLVMVISIVIDATRSRVLYRTAHKYKSQALEADALHFSTDIWSSSVVLLGLGSVVLSERVAWLGFLKQADAIAAVGVAGIVVYVSIQLGGRTIQALLDSAPSGLGERVKSSVESIPGVIDCHQVRIRHSGPHLFMDIHILVDGERSTRETHTLTEEVERAIQGLVPEADITVHTEPGE